MDVRAYVFLSLHIKHREIQELIEGLTGVASQMKAIDTKQGKNLTTCQQLMEKLKTSLSNNARELDVCTILDTKEAKSIKLLLQTLGNMKLKDLLIDTKGVRATKGMLEDLSALDLGALRENVENFQNVESLVSTLKELVQKVPSSERTDLTERVVVGVR